MSRPVQPSPTPPTVLDRVISWFDPVQGARRVAARQALRMMTGPVGGVSRTAGSRRDRLFGWLPRRLRGAESARERETALDRAEDLASNDGFAASATSSLALNVVGGAGVRPQSRLHHEALGISEEEATAFSSSAEDAFELWAANAGMDGSHFYDLQYRLVHSVVTLGEFCQIPLMRRRKETPFALCLQTVHPTRLRTPADRQNDPSIHDGVEFAVDGSPRAYWVADPEDGRLHGGLTSASYRRYERLIGGYRPGFFHCFQGTMPEQVRGVSVLAPGAQLFRHLADYLDYSLMQAIVSASLAVFVETEDPVAAAFRLGRPMDGMAQGGGGDGQQYQEITPGMFMYGRAGEKPHILESKNPPPAFDQFVERIVRAISASTGQPYEVVARDFSKTNYSSARAALLEVWKLYKLYHSWFVRNYCQKIWEMVVEEAWLKGLLAVPKGAPDFWAARHLWTECVWTPPARGYVDPVKEISANILALENNLTTMADLAGEQGRDYQDILEQRARERKAEEDLGIAPRTSAPAPKRATPTTRQEDKD